MLPHSRQRVGGITAILPFIQSCKERSLSQELHNYYKTPRVGLSQNVNHPQKRRLGLLQAPPQFGLVFMAFIGFCLQTPVKNYRGGAGSVLWCGTTRDGVCHNTAGAWHHTRLKTHQSPADGIYWYLCAAKVQRAWGPAEIETRIILTWQKTSKGTTPSVGPGAHGGSQGSERPRPCCCDQACGAPPSPQKFRGLGWILFPLSREWDCCEKWLGRAGRHTWNPETHPKDTGFVGACPDTKVEAWAM